MLPAGRSGRQAVSLFLLSLFLFIVPWFPERLATIGGILAVAALMGSVVCTFASRKHSVRDALRTGLGRLSVSALAASAVVAAASLGITFDPGLFGAAGILGLVAAVLGVLAWFRLSSDRIPAVPHTAIGWWSAGLLAPAAIVQFSPWASLSGPAGIAATGAALVAILCYHERSVLAAAALVTTATMLFYSYALFLVSDLIRS